MTIIERENLCREGTQARQTLVRANADPDNAGNPAGANRNEEAVRAEAVMARAIADAF